MAGMTIWVSTVTGRRLELEVESATKIIEMRKLCETKDSGTRGCNYIFAGKELLDPMTLADYNIQRDSTIHAVLCLRCMPQSEYKLLVDAAEDCSICLTKMIPGGTVDTTLPCKHSFHTDCIRSWFEENKDTCPVCRIDLTKQ